MTREATRRSKLLSFVLRHGPGAIGIELDEAGWTPVAGLIAGLSKAGEALSLADLEAIVETSDKQRFSFSPDRTRIRANQGHSVPVDLGLTSADPPRVLYHGTTARFLDPIAREGLRKGKRHHVHLHADPDIARAVGARRGKPVVLAVDAASMSRDGFTFYLSANHVWLTEAVPPAYLKELDGGQVADRGEG